MHVAKITEHTNIHVDDSLVNNFTIKTRVYMNKAEPKAGDEFSKQHLVMYIKKDLAENEKDASLNAQEENKDVVINNRSKNQQVSVKASINGADDVKDNSDQQHENVGDTMEKEA